MGFHFTVDLLITICIMVLVAVITGTLTARIKKDAGIAQQREQCAQELLEINQKLLSAQSLNAIASVAKEYLEKYFNCPAILYIADPSFLPAPACGEESVVTDEQIRLFYDSEQIKQVHRLFQGGEMMPAPGGNIGNLCNIPVASNCRSA